MKKEILRIIASVFGSSALMFCFYMSVWVSDTALDGKYLLCGFVVMIHFALALLIYITLHK